ncbi:TOMM precursor leader peptide-binding protein [Micromonospora sp. NPDC050417]|uniref:TOMM precursor leader peptide-binding protein n=1 Tax=Micromonospora sp. NPDC050417 TaxID=3364280 RepID=UPI0037883F5C
MTTVALGALDPGPTNVDEAGAETEPARSALVALLADAGHPVYDLTTALAAEGGTALVALARWTPEVAETLSRRAWETSARWLPVCLDGGLVLVGPMLGPDTSACLGCAESARLTSMGPKVPHNVPGLRLGGVPAPVVGPVLVALAAAMLADPQRYDATVVAIRADRATCSTHRVRPRGGGCHVCAPLPADGPEPVQGLTEAHLTTDPDSLRAPNPRTGRPDLRDALFDWRYGPVAHVFRAERLPVPLVTAELVGESAVREGGYGRAVGYAEAEQVALFESVERLTGMRPRRRRTVVEASFAELGPDIAIDPVTLGPHDPRYHDHPAFHLTPYRPDLRVRWVYGWSLRHRRPVAVPEHVAYWGLPRGRGPQFLYESSNGCGLGNSRTEAVLYGLFEVAERDAFLMAWYARTPLRRIALPDDDPLLPHLVDDLERIGYELLLFDATNDLGVPAVLGMTRYRGDDERAPVAFFAAGAHPNPRSAMRSAAAEAIVNTMMAPDLARSRPDYLDRDRLRPMLDRPELVHSLDDHVGLNTLPEAASRHTFLFDGGEPADWRELWPGLPAPTADLGRALDETVGRLGDLGLEVLAVDQTDPAIAERLGLYAAKVIVPGTLPMTFGQVNHRTLGLPRLLEVPYRLGRVPAPLHYEALPLHPHPFP